MLKEFLHVGCGRKHKDKTTKEFAKSEWKEVRFDIEPVVKPDIIGSMLDMGMIKDNSYDALYSSHNIEHVYFYQVNQVLKEFYRVINEDGYALITCPDLQQVSKFVADGKLLEEVYSSGLGPITPMDILFGFGQSLEAGSHFMAHKCGFTGAVLRDCLLEAGFQTIIVLKREAPNFDIFAFASKAPKSVEDMKAIASLHFPNWKDKAE